MKLVHIDQKHDQILNQTEIELTEHEQEIVNQVLDWLETIKVFDRYSSVILCNDAKVECDDGESQIVVS